MIKKKSQRSWREVFASAFAGLFYAFSHERNFKVHGLISLAVVALSWWLKISLERFLILLLAIIIGFSLEMANSVFEAIVNLITEEYHPQAKVAKDVAAGTVLLAAFGLALIGFLILLPPLWQKIF